MIKALSLPQPQASLICPGRDQAPIKTIVTMKTATEYRGDLLICSTKRKPSLWTSAAPSVWCDRLINGDGWAAFPSPAWKGPQTSLPPLLPLPFGMVLGVARLADCVPIVGFIGPKCDVAERHLCVDGSTIVDFNPYPEGMWGPVADREDMPDRSDQAPYGDYSTDDKQRFGWLLDDIRSLSEPVPAKGRQGLWRPDDDLVGQVNEQLGTVGDRG